MAARVSKSAVLDDISILTSVLCSHLKAPRRTLIGRSVCIKLSLKALQDSSTDCKLCATICGQLGDQDTGCFEEDSEDEECTFSDDVAIDFKICRPGDSRSDKAQILNEAIGVCIILPDRQIITLSAIRGPAAWRPIWSKSESGQFERSLPVISHWLKECEENHPLCVNKWVQDVNLPTRLIEISETGLQAKLVETSASEYAKSKSQYIALSYCWGPAKVVKTQKETYRAFLSSLPCLELPKTIRDAITLCHKLSVRHLWVDSICIIQDDKDDWEQEALRMASVYQNAYLTLIASSSSSADGGILSKACYQVPTTIVSATEHGPDVDVVVRIPPKDGFRPIGHRWDRDPTFSRAWIFQETVLSLRALHFTKDQVLWQCQTHTTSEDGLWTGNMFDENRDRQGDHLEIWRSWVQNYSRRLLTNPEDRFASMAGVVDYFQALSGYTFCAGLWREALPFELMWVNRGLRKAPPHCWRGIPSWSWLKSAGGNIDYTRVLWQSRRTASKPVLNIATIEDVDITWSGRPLVTQPICGSLVLKARIVDAKIFGDGWESNWRIEPTSDHLDDLALLDDIKPTDDPWGIRRAVTLRDKWCMQLDVFHPDLDNPDDGVNISLLEVVSYYDILPPKVSVIYHHFLWVESIGRPNHCRRLGYGAIYTNFDIFGKSDIRNIVLV